MADVLHRVVVEMVQNGAASAQSFRPSLDAVSELGNRVGGLAGALEGYAGNVRDMLEGAAEKVGVMAMHLGAAGLAAGVGVATYGVVKLNNELEKTTISLGTIFSANGLSNTLVSGMSDASDIMKKIRADAKALPGETEDLLGIFKAVAIPGARAGADIGRLEKLSADIMAAGAVSGLDMHMVARESGQLLAGRAGAHNILGSMLFGLSGDAAEKFNKSSGTDRLKFLEKGMGKYAGSRDYFNTTFDAQWSSLVDATKNMIRKATEPVFNSVKKQLAELNDWVGAHGERIAQVIGDKLGYAWDKGTALAREWLPTILDFTREAAHEIERIWDRISPLIIEAASKLKDALGDGSAMKEIGKIIELYAMSKSGAFGGSSVGKGMGTAMGALVGGAGGAAAGGALGDVAGVGGMLFGAPGAAAEKAIEIGLVGAMKDHPKEAGEAMGRIAKAADHLTDVFNVNFGPAIESFAIRNINSASMAIEGLANGIDAVTHPLQSLATYTESAARQMGFFGDAAGDWIAKLHDELDPKRKMNTEAQGDDVDRTTGHELHGFLRSMGNTITSQNAEIANKKKITGGGGTNVQKVEIVVSSNADPSRVARMVFDQLQNLSRHPKISPDVRNYSSVR